jgi:DNA-3-methyladenine glycosylase II
VVGISATDLKASVDFIAQMEPRVAKALAEIGYPEARSRPTGYETILRTIVGQQVSVKAAAAIWRKLEAGFGDLADPAVILAGKEDSLRACGLSRQKQGYARSLAELVLSGELDLSSLPADDEEAIALLTKAKGIGRWSAEIYLLFAEGRPDIWPAGDLAVQIALGRILGLTDRPTEKQARSLVEDWRPHRGAMAIFAWHEYNIQAL